MTQEEKGLRFARLHTRSEAFIIPNPWDLGSARILEQLGFEALATTSAGFAFSIGKPDYAVTRGDMISHVAAIARSTALPVSADLQNGFGDSPEIAAETIKLAADAGLVGGSIEDSTGDEGSPIYELSYAADRIRAAVEASRALPFRFTLTARAENFLWGKPDLKDTIVRLQAYQEAGADVLYAPGLTAKEDIASVVRSLDKPVNVLMGMKGVRISVAELSHLGVKRISVGSGLSRAAYGAFIGAAREMKESGSFTFADEAISYAELCKLFES